MSIRSRVHKALRDLAKEKLPYLSFVDLQKGQMSNPTKNYPIPLPALLVEVGDFRFSNLLEQQQKGNGTISLYLYLDLVTDSFQGAESEEETIDMLNHFDELYETFQGFSIPDITPLVRTLEYKPQYGNRFIMFRIDFATTIDSGKEMEQPMVELSPPKFKFR